MISKSEINEILCKYDRKNLIICTLCSHSALQIFYGAKQEGFRTLGITTKNMVSVYKSFPLGCPEIFLILKEPKDILNQEIQDKLIKSNAIIIPHGSFVEYIGTKKLENEFYVPMFGNRKSLEWERDRKKQKNWLKKAGLKLPKEYTINNINGKVFVKFFGAKGGKGFFTASSKEEFNEKLNEKIRVGEIKKGELSNIIIQEFVPGVRYYSHYFYSLFEKGGIRVGNGRLELLSMDKRIETIDECYRGLPYPPEDFFDYTVSGNQPLVLRESLLPTLIKYGKNVIKASQKLFPPGLIGPFCLETIYHPKRGFIVFEISARIVAGTNLYPQGSPYSCYIFNEHMSTGRRIAREIKSALLKDCLEKIIY